MELLILIGLVVLNGVFAMSELAIVSAKRARLAARADKGDPGARAALRLQQDPSTFLSTVQIGITLVGVVAGAYGATALADDLAPRVASLAPALAAQSDEIAFGLVIALTTYLSLVVGELVPKRIALRAPEAVAGIIAAPMAALARLAFPAVWVLRASTEGLLRILGLGGANMDRVTQEEIQSVIDEGASSGAIETEERAMMRGVMRLADRDVRSIMTPRGDIVWVDLDDPPQAQFETMRQGGHSRFPLARGDLEHIVGIIQAKDLAGRGAGTEDWRLEETARPARYVPETLPVLELLEAMQSDPVRLALVVDEYGVMQGLVTPADLLGAIAGASAYAPDDGVSAPVQRDDGSWLIDGATSIDDLETILSVSGLAPQPRPFHTIAGLIMSELQRLPTVGDVVSAPGLILEVVDMDGRRVDKVLARRVAAEPRRQS